VTEYFRNRTAIEPFRSFDREIRAFDHVTFARVVRPVAAAPRYLKRPVAQGDATEPPRMYSRAITGDDADDPNTTTAEPGPLSSNPMLVANGSDEVCFFVPALTGSQSLAVEVWAQTDLYSNPSDTASRRIWVRAGKIASVEKGQEYRVATGLRNAFLRVTESAGIDVSNPITLIATVC
jgi:hypothetical protein